MAHFAQLDSNNKVIQVLVVANAKITDENGVEQEFLGIQYLRDLLGQDTNWAQTSYNFNFRGVFASPGCTFIPELDRFIQPQPYPSWGLDPATFEWKSPVPYPADQKVYVWDEEAMEWALI